MPENWRQRPRIRLIRGRDRGESVRFGVGLEVVSLLALQQKGGGGNERVLSGPSTGRQFMLAGIDDPSRGLKGSLMAGP